MQDGKKSKKKNVKQAKKQARKQKEVVIMTAYQTPLQKEYTRCFLSYPIDVSFIDRMKLFMSKYGLQKTRAYELSRIMGRIIVVHFVHRSVQKVYYLYIV